MTITPQDWAEFNQLNMLSQGQRKALFDQLAAQQGQTGSNYMFTGRAHFEDEDLDVLDAYNPFAGLEEE